jgi:hypothetical protein
MNYFRANLNQPSVVNKYLPCVLSGLVLSSAYWITSLIVWGREDISIKAIYRYGDLQYYPLIAALAKLDLHPTYSAFFESQGAQSFPLFAEAVPALLFGLFGWWAFPIIDFIYFSLALIFLDKCFVLAGLRPAAAWASAVVCVTGSFLFEGRLAFVNSDLYFGFYGLRDPRPFLSGVSYFAFVWSFLSLSENPERLQFSWRTNNWWPVIFGLAAAALLQSDIYNFVSAAAAGGMFVAINLMRRKLKPIGWSLLGLFVVASTFLMASLPFLLQLHFGAPDLIRRYGVYALDGVNRWLICESFVKSNIHVMSRLSVALLSLYFALKLFGHRFPPSASMGLAILAASGFIGSLIFFFLSPSATQIYHFWWVARLTYVIPLFAFAAILADRVWAISADVVLRKLDVKTNLARVRKFLFAPIAAWAILGFWVQTASEVSKTEMMRSDYFQAMRVETFRRELNDVISYLDAHAQGNSHLLLTNDHHVLTWWIVSGRGALLMPDVFSTTLSQTNIETQLCMAGKYLGWSHTEFLQFLTPNTTPLSQTNNMWFLGGNLYSASASHHKWPLADYPLEFRDTILSLDIGIDSWQILMPISETKRLGDLYDQTKVDAADGPDFVVVLRNPLFVTRHIDTARYSLEYLGDNYLVFRKKAME